MRHAMLKFSSYQLQVSCVHEQPFSGYGRWDGHDGQQRMLFVTLMDHAKQFKAHSSQLYELLRCLDMAIW